MTGESEEKKKEEVQIQASWQSSKSQNRGEEMQVGIETPN